MLKNRFTLVFLTLITVVAFIYRFKGITANHPFWVDEFSTAAQAKMMLSQGWNLFSQTTERLEPNNYLYHAIVAFFFKMFGAQEWFARLPAVIFGSLVPAATFILSARLSNITTAIGATLLTTFSYFQIVWSRQARGYALQQLILILTTYIYIILINQKKKSKTLTIILVLLLIIGILTHKVFFILIFSMALHFIFINRQNISKYVKTIWFYITITALLLISLPLGIIDQIKNMYSSGLIVANNVWYYHSFLWREYGLITFLGLVGLTMLFMTRRKELLLILLFIGAYLMFLFFFFAPYVSRYLLLIFPFLFIGVAYAITYTTQLFLQKQTKKFNTQLSLVIPVIIILAIIANGHKFATKPDSFYSVNHDFREIALVDYHQVYNVIKEKGNISEGKTAVIDTWFDRLHWYMGENYPHAYMFRWINNPGLSNGLPMTTSYTLNKRGEKVIPQTKNLRFIGELSDLKKAMKNYPRGFIFIDDSTMPQDVIKFAEKNLKEELYLEHFPLDENPYSIWPAKLYSWGIE